MKRTSPLLLGVVAGLALPFSARGQEAPAVALTPLETVRVERAVELRFSCLGCHRIEGRGGRIGPELDGLSARADIDYVRSILSGTALTASLMPHQPMPDRDRERLARYLLSRAPSDAPSDDPPEAPPALAPTDSLNGPALYARHCAACHGSEGAGDGWNAPDLPVTPTPHADAQLMSERPDDTLYDAIAVGGWVLDKSNRMPGFRTMLSPAQIRALVAHIRTLCDCSQPAWAAGGGQ